MKRRLLLFVLIITTIANALVDVLCTGRYWTGDEANLVMKQFASKWNDLASWKKRADIIRLGMKLDRMPNIKGNFNPIIKNKRVMDGYTVENVAIESFSEFYITRNIYSPIKLDKRNAAVLSPHALCC